MDTQSLFTFEIELGSMPTEQLEDVIYNCLDFCLLYGKTAHFFLLGDHPALWRMLEIFREEQVTFSLLTEPEQSTFHEKPNDGARMVICGDGTVKRGEIMIGNAFTDRLADLWAVFQCEGVEST